MKFDVCCSSQKATLFFFASVKPQHFFWSRSFLGRYRWWRQCFSLPVPSEIFQFDLHIGFKSVAKSTTNQQYFTLSLLCLGEISYLAIGRSPFQIAALMFIPLESWKRRSKIQKHAISLIQLIQFHRFRCFSCWIVFTRLFRSNIVAAQIFNQPTLETAQTVFTVCFTNVHNNKT